MFCTACATPNPTTLPACRACGAHLAAPATPAAPSARRGGPRVRRALGWLRLVPVLAVLLGLGGVGASYARQMSRQSDAYAAAEAALDRGDPGTALAAFERAGGYRDAEARRVALTARLLPYRSAYLAAVDAIAVGDHDDAIALLTGILRDEPRYGDAAALLETARERRRAALAAGAELAVSRKDWLTAETLLAQLVVEDPSPDRVAELAEIRRRRSPVLYTSNGNIMMATPEGTDVVEILNGYDAIYPTWSPDRRSVAFYAEVGQSVITYNLLVVDRAGGDPRLVADHVYHAGTFPAWSPDGTRIAYINQESFELNGRVGVTSIRVTDVATGHTTDLSDTAAYQTFSPTWSPDGSRVAFISKHLYGRSSTILSQGVGSVLVADLAAGTVTDLTTDRLRFVDYVAWSPTRDVLAVRSRETATTSAREATITTIHLLDPATGELTPVTGRDRFVSWPIWSPHGDRFAYVDGDLTLMVVALDGASQAIPLQEPVFDKGLTWSPDGAHLIAPPGRTQLGSFVVPLDPTNGLGFLFPRAWDNSGDLVGPPRWGSGRPLDPPPSPTLAGTALDHP